MKYDQHFLQDFETAKKIVSFLDIKKNEKILEIGPGKGILTQYLHEKVTLTEIDKRLYKGLKEKFPQFKVINGNVLNYNEEFDKIISNVPYSICEPLMNKLLRMQFKKAILMFPEKFMTKGLLSLVMPHFFEIRDLLTVSKNLFYPVPKINSKILEIKKRSLNNKEKILLSIYLQSDKKLKNVFDSDLSFKDKRIYQMNFDEWKELVVRLGL
ncbi:MAG: rRNA adenine N-6-methyltransferase family protein [Nanoarchaeota archaeon]